MRNDIADEDIECIQSLIGSHLVAVYMVNGPIEICDDCGKLRELHPNGHDYCRECYDANEWTWYQ